MKDDARTISDEMGSRVLSHHPLTYEDTAVADRNGSAGSAGNVVMLSGRTAHDSAELGPLFSVADSVRLPLADVEVHAGDVAGAWPHPAEEKTPRRSFRLQDLGERPVEAMLLRVAAVVLPISAVLLTSVKGLSVPQFSAVLLLFTCVWLAMQHAAVTSAKLSPFAVGIWPPSLIGAINGVIAVAAISVVVRALSVELPELIWMFLGVFVASCVAEALVLRFGRPTRLLLVGVSESASELLGDLADNEKLPFEWVGVVTDEASNGRVLPLPVLGTLADLPRIVPAARPDLVVVADLEQRDRAIDHLVGMVNLGFRIVGVPEIYEYALGRVPIRHLPPAWFMSLLHLYQRGYSRAFARVVDVTVAGFGMLIALPLYLAIAISVRCSSRGPVFFRQERVGEGGKPFQLVKFRTMVDGAENGEAVWAAERDSRITPVGRVLRATRMDEVPQLWNVLRGDMSIIGPRPERPEFLELLEREVPFWARRLLIKPGITGWAQVQGGYASDTAGAAKKLSYDLYYLKHRSMWLNFAIFAKTAATVVSRSGAR